jgi:hypothetical protein
MENNTDKIREIMTCPLKYAANVDFVVLIISSRDIKLTPQ